VIEIIALLLLVILSFTSNKVAAFAEKQIAVITKKPIPAETA